jgi:hypothetical protein
VKILKKWPPLCDFCVTVKPTLVFDIPPGTPLTYNTRERRLDLSSGWLGSCPTCAEIVASRNDVARRLGIRFVDAHPEAYRPPAPPENTRESVLAWWECYCALLLKKVTNLSSPRPYVPFEDPFEGKLIDITDEFRDAIGG